MLDAAGGDVDLILSQELEEGGLEMPQYLVGHQTGPYSKSFALSCEAMQRPRPTTSRPVCPVAG
eukprot:109469-Chlamydomonas_euryale.AAC.1